MYITGKDGVEGKTPEHPGFHFFGGSFGEFDFTSGLGVSKIPPFLTVDYELKGKSGIVPSKGGDGGCGGLGGHQGDEFVVEFTKEAKLSIMKQKGRAVFI